MKTGDIVFNCPACNSNKIADKWLDRRISSDTKIFWCANCGFGWQYPMPMPKEIHDYYDNYTVYNIHGANEKEESCQKRVCRIDKLQCMHGRLLDIGSGIGIFLKIAKKDGWDVTGIEPQKSAALYCRNQLGIDVHLGTIRDVKLEPESFDVVTLWDVWEHVYDPLFFLDQCIKLIRPGGLFVMSVPNASGWPARIFKGQWRYVMKTHLNYFTLSYVRRIITQKSMMIERIDHTMKIQSMLQGFASRLPLKIDTERIIRLGRKGSIEQGRPEQSQTNDSTKISPIILEILSLARFVALKINLASLPGPYGDMMDIYCRKQKTSI